MPPAKSSPYLAAKKSMEQRTDIKMIAIYSAKNTITKRTDLYSVLNPETSSLSPSAKSKGLRLASASTLTEKSSVMQVSQPQAPICFSWVIS